MSFIDKAKNAAQKMMGEGKEKVGEQTNNPDMAADGQKDQVASDLKQAGEKAKDAIPALQDAEHDKDARVREGAGVALSRIDPEHFVSPTQKARSK